MYALPFLGNRLLPYGSRGFAERPKTAATANGKVKETTHEKLDGQKHPRMIIAGSDMAGFSSNIIDRIALIRVPHSFFTHFYIVSFSASLFWLHQLYTRGAALQWIASFGSTTLLPTSGNSMILGQVWLLWVLLFIQGTRRLVESYVFSKSSKSTMHIAHWLIGLAFYVADSIAIWVEGMSALLAGGVHTSFREELGKPKAIFGLCFFVVASIVQNRVHARLASLTSYQIPPGKLFQYVLCPHYTAEVVIYICFAILGAPQGTWLNVTMVAALIFVVSNLAVTAIGTRQWYVGQFGAAKVGARARLIPFVW